MGYLRFTLSLLVTGLLVQSTRADILFLNQGGRVEGELLNPDESPRTQYLVLTADGVKLTLLPSLVDRVVVKSELERKYEAFVATMPDTAENHWKIADTCGKYGLSDQREFHLEQVIRLDVNHEDARHALGYSRIDGNWIKQADVMEEKGYIRAGGAWRLPQELELEAAEAEIETKRVKWRKDLHMWRDWLVKGRDPQKSIIAEQSIRAIRDPLAARPLVELLAKEKEAALVLLYVDVLAQIGGPESLVTLVTLAIKGNHSQLRDKCLDKLVDAQSKVAVRQFIKYLSDEDNRIVNRAAVALSRMNDPEATPALIDALVTTHKSYEGGSGMSPTFTGDGGAGLSMGGPKVVRRKFTNDPVLRTLMALNPGTNFGFNQAKWKDWYKWEHNPVKYVPSLRRSE